MSVGGAEDGGIGEIGILNKSRGEGTICEEVSPPPSGFFSDFMGEGHGSGAYFVGFKLVEIGLIYSIGHGWSCETYVFRWNLCIPSLKSNVNSEETSM